MSAAEPLRVLVLEDNPDDAELAVLELRRAGFQPVWERVESESQFRAALLEPCDLVLADFNLPDFDGAAALDVVNEMAPDVPLIIVSGSIGEDTAVDAMQRGAADYVLKDRLARLGQAARRALDGAADRRQRQAAEDRLRRFEQREARRRVAEAERGRRLAEAASASKSEFLNLAAHELRTPLSVLSGYVSLLLDGSLGGPGDHWLDPLRIAQQKAAELNRLVDSLLQAARIGAENVAGDPEDLDLAMIASDTVQRAGARARLERATLLLTAPAEPVQVVANAAEVARILDNLIDNALTYGGEAAWVHVTVCPDGSVDVDDHGPGVPDGEREAIFERFHRVHDRTRPSPPGTGLGLYIARELARHYGGSVDLVSTSAGEGSRFRLRLPLAPETRTLPKPHPAQSTA